MDPFTPMTIDRVRAEFPHLGAAWAARARRIDEGLGLHAVVALDADPAVSSTGPLRGVPVLVKATIDTATLPTTAGSLVLPETPPPRDAAVVAALRDAGATIAGKTSCSEWSNFRGLNSISGWSARYGLTRNPYDPARSAGGSSSGSAVAVAAGVAPVAVGTETDGSVLCPASLNGVIGFKVAPERLDRRGVIPISTTQDSLGFFTASADDLITVAEALGIPSAPLDGQVRLCVIDEALEAFHPRTLRRFREALALLADAGIEVRHLPHVPEGSLEPSSADELLVLRTELRGALEGYLATRDVPGLRTLADVVAANEELADVELAFFGQEHFLAALEADLSDPLYQRARERNLDQARSAMTSALEATGAVALLAPTMDVAWLTDTLRGDPDVAAGYRLAAIAQGTSVSIPMGRIDHLPVGLCLAAPAGSEGCILELTALLERCLAPLAGRSGRDGAEAGLS